MKHINGIMKEKYSINMYFNFFKSILLVSFLGLFFLLAISCNGNKINEKKLVEIDSLLLLISNAEKQLDGIEFNRSEENNKKAAEQIILINSLIKDSLMINKNELISNFKNIVFGKKYI